MKYFWLNFLLLSFTFIPFISQAQEGPPSSKDESHFIGVVQYVHGQPQWKSESREAKKVQFKDFFQHGNEIELSQSEDYVKFIPDSRCVAVAYGPGTLHAPKNSSSTWEISEHASLRWICGDKESDTFTIAGESIKLSGASEIFYHNEQLLVRRGRVLASSGELEPNHIYERSSSGWEVKADNTYSYEQWKMNQELTAPEESLSLAKPNKPVRSRWALLPLGMGGGKMWHENPRLEINNLSFDSHRILSNFKFKDRSILLSLTYSEATNQEYRNEHYGPNPPSEPNAFNSLELVMAEIGLRYNHERAWSYFTRVGLGHMQHQSHSYYPDINAGLGHNISYLMGSVSAGVDRTFFTKMTGWGGIYVSAEIFLRRTLAHLGTAKEADSNYTPPSPWPSELDNFEGAITEAGLMIYVGPMLEF